MRAQIEALELLSRADLTQRQLEVELAEVQRKQNELKADVDRMRELLDRERAQLEEAERSKLNSNAELEAIAEKTSRSKKRHDVAKNNREVEATARELEVLRREKEERTAELTRLNEVTTEVRASLEKHEQDFSGLVELQKQGEQAAKLQTEELLARRNNAAAERKTAATSVRADLLRIYTMVATKRGTGVAECLGGICRGCNMALPPQLFNQILAADRIYQCPSCQRILLPRPGAR